MELHHMVDTNSIYIRYINHLMNAVMDKIY